MPVSLKFFCFKSIFCVEKTNPFTQRRQTASQNFTYKEDKGDKIDDGDSESDDFDEFYNDKSFLNTGMNTGMNNVGAAKLGSNGNYGQRATGFENAADTQSFLNRVSYKYFFA